MKPWYVTFVLEEGVTLDSREGLVEAECEAKLLRSGSASLLVLEYAEMTARAVNAKIQRSRHPSTWCRDRTLVMSLPGIHVESLGCEHAEYVRVCFRLCGEGRASIKGRLEPISR